MSFFKKAMASMGIGSAKVEASLESNRVRVGDEVRGTVVLTGGNIEQQVDSVYFDLMTYCMKETSNDTRIKENITIQKINISDSFLLQPGERKAFDFSFQIPFNTPMSFGSDRVWLSTGLDIKMAVDPSDKDYLEILPHPYVETVLDAMEYNLGFRLAYVENEYHPRLGHNLPMVQEFSFKPQSNFRGYFDEIEMIFYVGYDGVEILMEIDRRARGLKGLFEEMTDTDESHIRVNISSQDLEAGTGVVADILGDIFNHYR